MYICHDVVCDLCCDFCWYCIHGKNGEPLQCKKEQRILEMVLVIVTNSDVGYMNLSHMIVNRTD